MVEHEHDEKVYPSIGEIVVGDQMPTAVESLCMNCGKNGVTRILFTSIPFFREIIVMSFHCKHCGNRNNEIQTGSAVQLKGCRYRFKMEKLEDFQRQVVKSDNATFRLEELDFEIPAGKGVLTTIEGLLSGALEQLQESQNRRREVDAQVAEQVEAFITRLSSCVSGDSFPLTVVLDDPSGNSFLENPLAPKVDPQLQREDYIRTDEQQRQLGLQIVEGDETQATEEETEETIDMKRHEIASEHFHAPHGSTIASDNNTPSTVEKEVFEIPSTCPNCHHEGTSKTCITDIPFFKEVIIMSFNCSKCGYKTNEIKGGGPISEKGSILELPISIEDHHEWTLDMKRDVVKSNSAGIIIPELELEVTAGSLGGMYTTVEGLLDLLKESLFDGQAAEFVKGDSANISSKEKFDALEKSFDEMIEGKRSFTLRIKDPLANSYIYDPEPQKVITTEYERTFEENDDLGLNDMCVDNYDNQPEQDNKTNDAQETMAKLQKDGAKAHPHAVSPPM